MKLLMISNIFLMIVRVTILRALGLVWKVFGYNYTCGVITLGSRSVLPTYIYIRECKYE
jgi:hypothetical protein